MKRKIEKIKIIIICACLNFCVICPIVMAIIHSIVMGKYDYDRYDSDYYLVFDDVKNEYPRKIILFDIPKDVKKWNYLHSGFMKVGLLQSLVVEGHDEILFSRKYG